MVIICQNEKKQGDTLPDPPSHIYCLSQVKALLNIAQQSPPWLWIHVYTHPE